MQAKGGTEHATAVLVGPRALLIRGPSGAGKSKLAWELLQAAKQGKIHFAQLIADDRVALSVVNGALMAAVPKTIAGKIELRGSGVHEVPFEPFARIGLVVDLDAEDGERVPAPVALQTDILGVRLPRLPVPKGADALPLVLQTLGSNAIPG